MKEYFKLFTSWFKIGLFTFGGGYAMLPMMEAEIVDKNHWESEESMLEYYAIAQCTPGVIAVNTATFVGYKRKGILGALCATIGVVTPSIIIISLIASFINGFSDNEVVRHCLNGINVGVCALMTRTIVKMFKNNVKDIFGLMTFVCVLISSAFLKISSIYIVVMVIVISISFYYLKEKQNENH